MKIGSNRLSILLRKGLNMGTKIVVVGSINTDLVIQTPRMPAPGETLKGNDFHTIPGGKGANQAVAAARLGAEVSLIACVGDDEFGKFQQKSLAKDGIDLSCLSVIPDQKTGVALILVDDQHQNSIVLAPEANDTLSVAKVESHASQIAEADILICQLETPPESIFRAIEIAHAYQTQVILNPAPATSVPPSILEQVDYLIPNESEASALTGVQVKDLISAQDAAERLVDKGAKQVLLTLGEQGVVRTDGERVFHQTAPQVDAVDTTAAGDTFIGGLAVALGEGKTLGDAIFYAQHAAALAVSKLGAQTSIPTKAEVEAFLPS